LTVSLDHRKLYRKQE